MQLLTEQAWTIKGFAVLQIKIGLFFFFFKKAGQESQLCL